MIVTPNNTTILEAARRLKMGEVVPLPTETVYGLGGVVFRPEAVDKIFKIKGRPSNNPLIVHLADMKDLEKVAAWRFSAELTRRVSIVADKFWPGPLTIVLPKSDQLPMNVTAGSNTVAVRIPAHKVALDILRAVDQPIAAPSANRSGEISPTTAQHVERSFAAENLYILDGGPCQVGLESTVVNLCTPEPVVLRPGAVSAEQLTELLSIRVSTLSAVAVAQDQNAPLLSPGLLTRHYAPKTPVIYPAAKDKFYFKNADRVGLIAMTQEFWSSWDWQVVAQLTLTRDLNQAAQRLYAAMHQLDQADLDYIVIEQPSAEGIGLALRDRIARAAATD